MRDSLARLASGGTSRSELPPEAGSLLDPCARSARRGLPEPALLAALVDRLRALAEVAAEAEPGEGTGPRVRQALSLIAAGLFFEAHERLEPAWRAAQGDERRVLQGIIQAAAFWHHAHRGGPPAGASRLAAKALARLSGGKAALAGVELSPLIRALLDWQTWLQDGAVGVPPALPRPSAGAEAGRPPRV